MGLKMKDRYAALDLSKLPKTYQDEFDEMNKSTYGFTDEDLNDIFADNFNEMYSLVEKKYPDAIKKGGTIQKPKNGKQRVLKPKNKPEPIKVPASMRKKLDEGDIIFIEDQLTNDEESTDQEMIAHLAAETGMSESQAAKWVALRSRYMRMSVEDSLDYPTRTDRKKRARKGADLVSTRDNKEFDRKSHKNVGKKFYDENGKQWECVGYNAKLDECILKDADGKQISSCIKDMYTSNPVAKREKGNIVDECKETLKEAGFTVKEHKAGNKKVSRSEPRPEKVIIKERVEESFTPIMKDLRGSEDKEKENKLIIDILEEIQGSFTKFMNRISNLADDRKLDALKKIKKLLDEIID